VDSEVNTASQCGSFSIAGNKATDVKSPGTISNTHYGRQHLITARDLAAITGILDSNNRKRRIRSSVVEIRSQRTVFAAVGREIDLNAGARKSTTDQFIEVGVQLLRQ
jgi:hypothetical protein